MGRMSKIEQARWDGFNRACRIAKEQGVDALLEEQKRRGVSKISVVIPEAEFRAQMNLWKSNCLQTVLLMSIAVLHDEFDFGGRKRIPRFIKRFNQKSECLADDYLKWHDIAEQMVEETGIRCDLSFFKNEEGAQP